MQLYFVRHGQSENNARWDRTRSEVGRVEDPDLTDLGRSQAKAVARLLRGSGANPTSEGPDPHNVNGFGITHVYSSLMLRAVATADTVARALGLAPLIWEDLHEIGGIFTIDPETGERSGRPGRGRAYFETNYPNLVLPTRLGDDGWWNRPFEQSDATLQRANRFAAEFRARHGASDDRVVVVSHAGFYNYFLSALLNLPERDGFWFALNNGALSRFDFVHDDWVGLIYANRVDFLPTELIT